ncbi:insulin-like growth factor-binding protein 2-A [Huso huso]|uniref:Insulin-like growth factor-binding protein 2-A n=1 Tax=Huso huso TaxID=61971 RepID=A0ABR0ZEP0_HUSHU
MLLYIGCTLLLASVSILDTSLGEVVFRCPSCAAERQAGCPERRTPCAELVREPGCGCCPVCARQEGETCGVYTARCSTGLRCYPKPGSEVPLQELVQGHGRCGRIHDGESKGSKENGADSAEFLDHSEVSLTEAIPEGRKTNGQRNEAKDLAVIRLRQTEQERQMSKGPKQPHTAEVSKRTRLKPSLCQKQLDQVLEKISMMHIHDEKGPLEFLYTMHMPNCDKQGLYNLKQCKMSVNGQRGECWCVSPSTGKPIPNSPVMRGDPECNLYYNENEDPVPQK